MPSGSDRLGEGTGGSIPPSSSRSDAAEGYSTPSRRPPPTGNAQDSCSPPQAPLKRPRLSALISSVSQPTPAPAWCRAMRDALEQFLTKSSEKESWSKSEIWDIFDGLARVGMKADYAQNELVLRGLSSFEEQVSALPSKDDVEEIKEALYQTNPGYAAKVKIRKQLRDGSFDPAKPKSRQDTPRFILSVVLHVDDNREKNEKAGKEILLKVIQPRKNNIRMNCWQSRKPGIMVMEFPTAAERDSAKAILNPTSHKVLEKRNKKINLWIKFAQHLEKENTDELKALFSDMNPLLAQNADWDLDWIGKEDRRKLRLRTSAWLANSILNEAYLFSECSRHPVEVLRPLPFRCMKCLRFHHTRGEECKNKPACRYCGSSHESGSCPHRNQPDHYHCTSCEHYDWDGQPPIEATYRHEAMDSRCPARACEAHRELDRVKKILFDALSNSD